MPFESRFPVVKTLLDDIYVKRRSRLALAIEYLVMVKDQSPETFTEQDHMNLNQIAVILEKSVSDTPSFLEDPLAIDKMAIAFEAYDIVMAKSPTSETKWQDLPEDEHLFWMLIVSTVIDIVRKKYER